MSTILSIPANVLPDIREAIISFMGFATRDFNDGLLCLNGSGGTRSGSCQGESN